MSRHVIRGVHIICLAVSVVLTTAEQSVAATGPVFSTLYTFTGYDSQVPYTHEYNGGNPFCKLLQAPDGQLYGMSDLGGTNGGWGTVFRISTNGVLTTLYGFADLNDGYSPEGGFVLGPDGNLYGTAGYTGGSSTVFRISTNGSFSSVYVEFNGYLINATRLTVGQDGNLYGIGRGANGFGIVYKLTTNEVFTVLHSFNGDDGLFPQVALVQARDGRLYGTTRAGTTNGFGDVFAINTNGLFSVLYTFSGGGDGANPNALALGVDGNLYGTTYHGGINNQGTVFVITTNGVFKTLYSFLDSNDGAGPFSTLLLGSDGLFYGITCGQFQLGNTTYYSTIYSITTNGTLTTLHSFPYAPFIGGSVPMTDLVQGVDGSFYGATYLSQGLNTWGTVYKLTVPLNPPANLINAVNVDGTNVSVTVPSVAGAAYQLQYRNTLSGGSWSNVVGACTVSIGGPLTMTDSGGFPHSQRFYRFTITP